MARPTKFNEERGARIIDAVRNGAFLKTAARAAGIAPSTLYEWLRRGRAGEEPFSEFQDALTVAEAEAENEAASVIMLRVRAGDPRVAMNYLQRCHRERWGRYARPQSLEDIEREASRDGGWDQQQDAEVLWDIP